MPFNRENKMEKITEKEFDNFILKVVRARTIAGYDPKIIDHYEMRGYCRTLINGASLFQLIGSMECSDRMDLIEHDENDKPSDTLAQYFKDFANHYLGLLLLTHGDPRGAVFKLVVDPSLGDSFGDRTHLCVPCVDAYQSLC